MPNKINCASSVFYYYAFDRNFRTSEMLLFFEIVFEEYMWEFPASEYPSNTVPCDISRESEKSSF